MPRLDFYVNYKLFVKVKLESTDVVVGRSSECTVQLPDERVSRRHAIIRKSGQAYTIEDCSTHGTRVNDHLVSAPAELKPGDRIYIENYVIIYQPDDAPEANPSPTDTQTYAGPATPKPRS
jgi:pSer/pThr/pTyr-binding forkhead associated (FHA) protein